MVLQLANQKRIKQSGGIVKGQNMNPKEILLRILNSITFQEVIAFVVILALIILTFMYPTEFKDRFATAISAVLAAMFTAGGKSNKS